MVINMKNFLWSLVVAAMLITLSTGMAYAQDADVCVGGLGAVVVGIVGAVVIGASALSNMFGKETIAGKILNFLALNLTVGKKTP